MAARHKKGPRPSCPVRSELDPGQIDPPRVNSGEHTHETLKDPDGLDRVGPLPMQPQHSLHRGRSGLSLCGRRRQRRRQQKQQQRRRRRYSGPPRCATVTDTPPYPRQHRLPLNAQPASVRPACLPACSPAFDVRGILLAYIQRKSHSLLSM